MLLLMPVFRTLHMYLLFTTPTCPNCPRAKHLAEESQLDVRVIDASQREGFQLAQAYELSQVPALVEVDQEQRSVRVFSGIQDISVFFSSR